MILQSVERDDEHHEEKHRYILNLIKNERIDCVFLGDSITRRWEDNPDEWNRYFGDFSCANFGVGGDTLENLKWRIENGEMDGFTPKLIVLLIGTNNLPENDEGMVSEGILEIVSTIREKQPGTPIILLGLLPRYPDDSRQDYMGMINSVNSVLASRSADDSKLIYKDFGPEFLPLSDEKREEFMPDGLHLNGRGYDKIGPALKALLEQYIRIG